jgi:hypothetical protein
MPQAEFEPTIPVFELAKTVRALDCAATVTGYKVYLYVHIMWVPFHHGMSRPQVADGGEGLQMWKVGEHVLNKQSQIVYMG